MGRIANSVPDRPLLRQSRMFLLRRAKDPSGWRSGFASIFLHRPWYRRGASVGQFGRCGFELYLLPVGLVLIFASCYPLISTSSQCSKEWHGPRRSRRSGGCHPKIPRFWELRACEEGIEIFVWGIGGNGWKHYLLHQAYSIGVDCALDHSSWFFRLFH